MKLLIRKRDGRRIVRESLGDIRVSDAKWRGLSASDRAWYVASTLLYDTAEIDFDEGDSIELLPNDVNPANV